VVCDPYEAVVYDPYMTLIKDSPADVFAPEQVMGGTDKVVSWWDPGDGCVERGDGLRSSDRQGRQPVLEVQNGDIGVFSNRDETRDDV